MSDFMKWLYAHYIRPQLDAAPPDDYEMPLSLCLLYTSDAADE